MLVDATSWGVQIAAEASALPWAMFGHFPPRPDRLRAAVRETTDRAPGAARIADSFATAGGAAAAADAVDDLLQAVESRQRVSEGKR